LIASGVLVITGCGDFFAQKPTEIQSQNILRELEHINEVEGLDTPLPDIYLAPPKITETGDGAKLYYFTKHHSVLAISELINSQFAETLENDKKEKYTLAKYLVSGNPATNQLVVGCPDAEQAKAVLEFLEEIDVPPIQVKIDCLISELYADVTMDWETTIKIENLFGEKFSLTGKELDGVLLPAFPGAALRDVARANIGLKAGYSRNLGIAGHEFKAVVDMLVSRGYLKILMNPTLEVVNGKKARIETSDHVPLQKEVVRGDIIYNVTEYMDVIDSLEIVPHVFADGSIGLETKAVVGSKSTPEGVKQVSIITRREVDIEENRIRPGDSLIIGGIKKTERRSVVRGVPFLKDLPLIGILFSSKDFEERGKEVIFIITPTISTGGMEHQLAIEKIREKHARPDYGTGLQDTLLDPFGSGAYTDLLEQQTALAEFERFKADIEKAEALDEVKEIKDRLIAKAQQVLVEKAETNKARAEARNARQAAKRSRKQANLAKAQAEKAKAEAEKTQAEAEKIKEEYGQTQAEPEESMNQINNSLTTPTD
jgi:hypothetical protein